MKTLPRFLLVPHPPGQDPPLQSPPLLPLLSLQARRSQHWSGSEEDGRRCLPSSTLFSSSWSSACRRGALPAVKGGQVSEERKPVPPQHLTPSRGPRQPPRQADGMPTPAGTGRTRKGQEPGRVRGGRDRHHGSCEHTLEFLKGTTIPSSYPHPSVS